MSKKTAAMGKVMNTNKIEFERRIIVISCSFNI